MYTHTICIYIYICLLPHAPSYLSRSSSRARLGFLCYQQVPTGYLFYTWTYICVSATLSN